MIRKTYLFLAFIGLIGLFSSCEKDEDKATMLENPILPTIKTMPDLTLLRANATNTVKFVGTPVNPGFNASATYFLEVCAEGDNFADALVLYSGVQDTAISFTISELNGLLLKKFPGDQLSSADFRIRAILAVDAGTGAVGTSTNPLEYKSVTSNTDVTLYGLPRLDLIGSGRTQKIESALGDGIYTGYVKLDNTLLFTLNDPEANVNYGGADNILSIDGPAFSIPSSSTNGYYKLTVNTNDLTYSFENYMISIVGSALTGNDDGWNQDIMMDYDADKQSWILTTDLKVGMFKFRKNSSWGWSMGLAESGIAGELQQGGVGNDIPITAEANYTLTFTILSDQKGTFNIVKNN